MTYKVNRINAKHVQCTGEVNCVRAATYRDTLLNTNNGQVLAVNFYCFTCASEVGAI